MEDLTDLEFRAVFDDTGKILSVGPEDATTHLFNQIPIDKQIVDELISGNLGLDSIFVDFDKDGVLSVQVAQVQSIINVDNILHQVNIYPKSPDNKIADILISVNLEQKTITFNFIKKIVTRKTEWSPEMFMSFLVTGYNDPNEIYEILNFQFEEINTGPKIFENVEIPQNFSIYTRRIFKEYIVEI